MTSSARTLGRTAATLMTTGMIIGTGIFGALGATAEHAGGALLLAMIPGGLVCWATGISGAQLGVNFPRHGGAFVWARAFCAFRNFFGACSQCLGTSNTNSGLHRISYLLFFGSD